MLQSINRRATAYCGLIVAAATALKVVFDPAWLLALYHALIHIRAHAATDADYLVVAQAAAAFLGAAFLLYFGAPYFVRSSKPPSTGLSTSPPAPPAPEGESHG
jgi:hypothetical protein